GEVGEAFGAITPLQHEGLALGGESQMCLEAAGLPGENQRRISVQARFHLLQFGCVRGGRDLADRGIAPGIRGPGARGGGAGRGGGWHNSLLSLSYVAKPGKWLLPRSPSRRCLTGHSVVNASGPPEPTGSHPGLAGGGAGYKTQLQETKAAHAGSRSGRKRI